MKKLGTLAFLLAVALAACSNNPYYDASKPHRARAGFRNNYPHAAHEGFWKWQWERLTTGKPAEPEGGWRFPLLRPDLAYLLANRTDATMTWIGHSSFLLQLGGLNFITDPQFSERASPVSFAGPKRVVAPGLLAAELPHIDAVLISHNHYDHLDVESVRALARQLGGPPRFYVPLGLAAWFKDKGIDGAIELDWWQTNLLAAAQIQLVPVQHWSKRSLTDTNETLWGGWVIKHAGLTALFCGDTGYSKDFKDIAAKLGTIDLAFIPIGAYEPRWFMQPYHIDPAEAVQIQRELGAHNAVGMHWGTFGKLTDEPMNAPPQALNAALDANRMPRDRFFAMQHGETRVLHGSGPTASWVARTAAAPLPQLKSGGEKPSATLTVGLASR